MAPKKKPDQAPSFEKDLESLEKIVEELEEGGLSLDDSLKKFEEGMRLAQRCDKALNAAEKKIEILTRNAEGGLETEPFEDADGDSATSVPKPQRKSAGAEDSNASGESDDEEDEDGELLF